ncbi:MAG: type I methionyl aminopeptidase [Ignavibacteria bacterium 13_1_40CM_2_61_4]|nr:MAG: type I methionyl aminopeptidase [Ignavibacteria bacterium 13_1_40CM_2_61_4]
MTKATIKSPHEIALMRECCSIVAEVLRIVQKMIQPGITTRELDSLAEDYIRSRKGEPAFKGYGTERNNLFPASLCTSVDDEVVHGIPGARALREGEIISIDVGVKLNDFYGDGAWTYEVGKISEEKRRLLRTAEESLYKGIAQARAGNRVHDISAAVQGRVEREGYSVVRDLVGHGVGRNLHEEPAVPNYGQPGTGPVLQEGMTLAIEPMVNLGDYRVRVDDDGWTIRTADGHPSAHFEHTVLVTGGEPEILTT